MNSQPVSTGGRASGGQRADLEARAQHRAVDAGADAAGEGAGRGPEVRQGEIRAAAPVCYGAAHRPEASARASGRQSRERARASASYRQADTARVARGLRPDDARARHRANATRGSSAAGTRARPKMPCTERRSTGSRAPFASESWPLPRSCRKPEHSGTQRTASWSTTRKAVVANWMKTADALDAQGEITLAGDVRYFANHLPPVLTAKEKVATTIYPPHQSATFCNT